MLRFRLYSIVVFCNIEKAFLQVGLREDGRDFIRFMWIKNPQDIDASKNLLTYRLKNENYKHKIYSFLDASG